MDAESKQIVARIHKEVGVAARAQGFTHTGSSTRWWLQTESSLRYYVWAGASYSRYELQWAIVSAPAGEIIYEKYIADNPDYHVMRGHWRNVPMSPSASIEVDKIRTEKLDRPLALLVSTVPIFARHMARWSDERTLWEYLLRFTDYDGPQPECFYPFKGGMALQHAAALAAVARSPEAPTIVDRYLAIERPDSPLGRHVREKLASYVELDRDRR